MVADAGPLIALARIDRLELLPGLVEEVVVPDAVLEELRLDESRPGVRSLARAVRKQSWLQCRACPDESTIPGLGRGESAAIGLAQCLSCPLLVDERRGRNAARRRKVTVIGTGRLLVAAKNQGLIDTVAPTLEKLRVTGYRMSDALVEKILVLAGETPDSRSRL